MSLSLFSPAICSYLCQDTDNDHVPPLLIFNPSSVPSFNWGVLDGPHSPRSFYHGTVCKIVHWRRNIFKVPSGKFGNLFHELSHLFQAYADMESMALYAAMVMPSLLLQRPHSKSKTKELVAHLDCRLTL